MIHVPELIIINGVAGFGKTTTAQDRAIKLALSLSRESFMGRPRDITVYITAFSNSNRQLAMNAGRSRAPLDAPANFEYPTLDALMNKVLEIDNPDYDAEWSQADWDNALAGKPVPNALMRIDHEQTDGILPFAKGPKRRTIPSAVLYASIKGDRPWPSKGFGRRILLMDESQDNQLRHHVFAIMLLLSGYIEKLVYVGDPKQAVRSNMVPVTRRKGIAPGLQRDPHELLHQVGRLMGLSTAAIDKVKVNERSPEVHSRRISRVYAQGVKASEEFFGKTRISGIFSKAHEGDYELVGNENEDNPSHGFWALGVDSLPSIKSCPLEAAISAFNHLKHGLTADLLGKIDAIEYRTGVSLLSLYHEDAVEDIKALLTASRDPFEELRDNLIPHDDCFSGKPISQEGRLVERIIKNDDPAQLFLDLLRYYLQCVSRKELHCQRMLMTFSSWIDTLASLGSEKLLARLNESGITDEDSFIEMLEMKLSSKAMRPLFTGPMSKFLLCWTVDKSKGQTLDGVLILGCQLQISLQRTGERILRDRPDLKRFVEGVLLPTLERNIIYVAITRSNRTLLLKDI